MDAAHQTVHSKPDAWLAGASAESELLLLLLLIKMDLARTMGEVA